MDDQVKSYDVGDITIPSAFLKKFQRSMNPAPTLGDNGDYLRKVK